MVAKKKVLAISGSTRKESSNGNLIKAIAALSANEIDLVLFDDIASLPHFNPDDDNETAPAAVTDFRKQLKAADGILICTPEYAMGLPGSLKNAIDWTVSSCEFSHKPVAAITASSSGKKAHQSLLDTLAVIEANIENTSLLISFIKTKVNADGSITDAKTLSEIESLIANFTSAMKQTDQQES